MRDWKAIEIVRGRRRAPEAVVNEAWQHLIDTGLAWQLDRKISEGAAALINAGGCKPAERSKHGR